MSRRRRKWWQRKKGYRWADPMAPKVTEPAPLDNSEINFFYHRLTRGDDVGEEDAMEDARVLARRRE